MAGHTVIAILLALLAIAIPTVWASFASKVKGHSIPGAVYFGALVCVVAAGALFFIGILRRNATEKQCASGHNTHQCTKINRSRNGVAFHFAREGSPDSWNRDGQ